MEEWRDFNLEEAEIFADVVSEHFDNVLHSATIVLV